MDETDTIVIVFCQMALCIQRGESPPPPPPPADLLERFLCPQGCRRQKEWAIGKISMGTAPSILLQFVVQ